MTSGIGVFELIQPGDASLSQYVTDAASKTIETAGNTNISLLDTVVNIVPSNIVKPFLEADMLQIIFIAIICGAAVGMIGDYSKGLKTLFESFNILFLKIATADRKIHTTGSIVLHDLSCHAYRNRDTAGHYELLRNICAGTGSDVIGLLCAGIYDSQIKSDHPVKKACICNDGKFQSGILQCGNAI